MERLIVALLLAFASLSPALAQEEGALEVGDFASAIAPGKPLSTPPGIYAQIAQRADEFRVDGLTLGVPDHTTG